MFTSTLWCPSCGNGWKSQQDHHGQTYRCSQCHVPVVAGGSDQPPWPSAGPAMHHRRSAPVKVNWFALAAAIGAPAALLFLGAGFLLMLLMIVSGGSHSEPEASRNPVAQTTRNPVAQATRRAWVAMQRIDSEARSKKFAKPSQKYTETALLYSRIDLTDADPQLVAHFTRMTQAYRDAGLLLAKVEAEADKLDTNSRNAAQVGALVGELASEKQNAQRNAKGVGVLFGILAEASQAKARKSLKQKYAAQVARLKRQLQQINDQEQVLAKTLTKKYGMPFVDLL